MARELSRPIVRRKMAGRKPLYCPRTMPSALLTLTWRALSRLGLLRRRTTNAESVSSATICEGGEEEEVERETEGRREGERGGERRTL